VKSAINKTDKISAFSLSPRFTRQASSGDVPSVAKIIRVYFCLFVAKQIPVHPVILSKKIRINSRLYFSAQSAKSVAKYF